MSRCPMMCFQRLLPEKWHKITVDMRQKWHKNGRYAPKVTQKTVDMRQKCRKNGRYAPKVTQNGTPRVKVTCIVSRSTTQIFDAQLKHDASDWLVISGHSRAIWSSFVIIDCITFWICHDLPEETVYELRHNLGHLWRIVEPYLAELFVVWCQIGIG